MPNIEAPPLAIYKSIADYMPNYADFVIWSGWLRTWYGLVTDYDASKGQVAITIEGTPRLLVTMHEDEVRDNIMVFQLSDIRQMKRGRWYIQQKHGAQYIWYV